MQNLIDWLYPDPVKEPCIIFVGECEDHATGIIPPHGPTLIHFTYVNMAPICDVYVIWLFGCAIKIRNRKWIRGIRFYLYAQ